MGNRSGKENEQLKQFTRKYNVVQEDKTKNISYLEEKATDRQCLIKETTFNDKDEFNKAVAKVEERKEALAGEQHLTELLSFLKLTQDHFCSNFYKLYVLYDYPHKTLREQISERQQCHRRFQQKQLWSILASCILGLCHLQKAGIPHESLRSSLILLTPSGIIKVCDPFSTNQKPNYESLFLHRHSSPHLYLSPQQCTSLSNQHSSPHNVHTYKSDVFTMGMIMLEAGLLTYQDECYREGNSKINEETVSYNLQRFGDIYSVELKSMVELMLEREEAERPGWLELERYVKTGEEEDEGEEEGEEVGDQEQRGSREQRASANHEQVRQVREVVQEPVSPPKQPEQEPFKNTLPIRATAPVPVVMRRLGGSIPHSHKSQPISSSGSTQFNPHLPKTTSPSTYLPPTTAPIPYPVQSGHITRTVTKQPQQPFPSLITHMLPSNISEVKPPFHGPLPSNDYKTRATPDQNLIEVDAEDLTITREPDGGNNTTYGMTSRTTQPPAGEFGRSVIGGYGGGGVGVPVSQYVFNGYSGVQQQHSSWSNAGPAVAVPYRNTAPTTIVTSNYVPNIPPPAPQPFPPQSMTYHPAPPTFSKPPSSTSHLPTTISPTNHIPANHIPLGSTTTYHMSTVNPYHDFNFNAPQHRLVESFEVSTNRLTDPIVSLPPPPSHKIQYVKETFKQGSRYEGEKVNDMRHGNGRFYYQDGGMYDGDWSQNRMTGNGRLYYQSGKIAYDGQWKDDQFMGFGILYNQYPEPLDTGFDYTNLDLIDEYWTKFEGDFADDLKQGQGKLFLSNGEYFEGEFDRDAVNGQGRFYTLDGEVINGIWNQNLLERRYD